MSPTTIDHICALRSLSSRRLQKQVENSQGKHFLPIIGTILGHGHDFLPLVETKKLLSHQHQPVVFYLVLGHSPTILWIPEPEP